MNDFWAKLVSVFSNNLLNKLYKKNRSKDSDNFAVATDDNLNNIGFAQDLGKQKFNRMSQNGIDLICGFEGLQLRAYDDGTGVCTIGYGTTIYPDGQTVQYGDHCTIRQAKSFMQHDLNRFEQAVNKAVKVPLNQNQFDALVSLTYNIGIGAFRSSTLLKLLNNSDYIGASNQFDVWVKAGGQTVQGLVNRRAVEKACFLDKKGNITFKS